MNIFLSLIIVGILFISLGIQQTLLSAMTESLVDTFNFSQWYINLMFTMSAIPAFLITILASRHLSRLTLRTCHRVGGIAVSVGLVMAMVMFYVDNDIARMGLTMVSQILAGIGWIMLKSSTHLILNNRCAKSHLYVRYSLWNVIALFVFVGMIVSYVFVPMIINYSINMMTASLFILMVITFTAVYISPKVFAGYIDMTWRETSLNPPSQHLTHIGVISIYNLMTFGLWSAFLLYLPEIILTYKESAPMVDSGMLAFFFAIGVIISFIVSLVMKTKERWIIAVLVTTNLAIAGCVMTIFDSVNPTFGIFILTIACCCFYNLATVASNALFFGDMLNTAFIWLEASRLLGVIIFPQCFSLMLSNTDAVLIFVSAVLVLSLVPAYTIYRFFGVLKESEFAQRNRNFVELVSGDADTHKEKTDLEQGEDGKDLGLGVLIEDFNSKGERAISPPEIVVTSEKGDYLGY